MRNFLVMFMLLGLILAGEASVSADQLTMQEGANISLSATAGPNSTLTISSTDTDENVKVSADDTTAGFLNGKLVGGAGITLTEGNGGANETLTIAAPETLTTKGDVLVHDGTSETRLAVGASGQFLTSDTSGNLLWANPAEGDQLFNSNVLLNAYRTAENLDLTVSKMIDGAVDAFTDSSGVDATASTNEDFDSSNDYYEPTRTGTTTIPMVNFDGTIDKLTKASDLTGTSDTDICALSFFITPASISNGNTQYILASNAAGSGSNFYVGFTNLNKIFVVANTSTPTALLHTIGSNSLTGGNTYHVMIDIDLGNSVAQIYINDVAETMVDITKTTGNIDFTATTWAIGHLANFAGSVGRYDGDIGHFWFDIGTRIDMSVVANRRKFIDALGNPVDLGSDGSTPTGTSPIIYLNNTTATWQNNLGSGGNFTENGALTDGTDLSTSGTADNLTLVSNFHTAKTEPNGANILLMAEDLAADITLNTDLKASVSRDGGTTFTQVTLSDAGEFEKGNLLTGTVDISGQPTGTDMEWKVETLNNKFLNLHGVGLEWR